MNCPICQGRSEVTHTQRRSESVLRDRRCKVCDNTFNTLEMFHVKRKGEQRKQLKSTAKPAKTVRDLRRAAEPMREREYDDEFYIIDDLEAVSDVLREMGVDGYGR